MSYEKVLLFYALFEIYYSRIAVTQFFKHKATFKCFKITFKQKSFGTTTAAAAAIATAFIVCLIFFTMVDHYHRRRRHHHHLCLLPTKHW